MKLLVVEDEKKLCEMIAKSLHRAGYEVDTCNDGEKALDMIYAEMYDLIVLDLNLPGMDGMEILRELRKENEETKVLILSARSQISDKVEGLDSGANDYMEKPFHLQELEARVRSLTRRTVGYGWKTTATQRASRAYLKLPTTCNPTHKKQHIFKHKSCSHLSKNHVLRK